MLIDSLLAENIKKYRTDRNLTQTELARKIHVSCQAISKWERGAAVPELDKLCLLADEFQVTLDELIGNLPNAPKMMIGVDGGGSKTEFILFDEDGRIAETLVLGPCNPNSVGIEGAVAVLTEGIDRLRAIAPRIQGIFIGSAGFKSGGNGKKIAEMLHKKYLHIAIRCETDIANVFASASEEQPLIAGICGTGTVVYVKINGECRQYTGWGYLLDRAGSGFHIGRDALTAALEDLEGLGKKTHLTELIEKRLGVPLKEGLRTFYHKDSAYIASFAQCVFEAYDLGDGVAKVILETNAERFAQVINRVAAEQPRAKSVLLAGSIVTKNEIFLKMVQKYLDLKIILPTLSQAEGACILCAEMCGLETERLYKVFKENQAC